MSEPVSTRFPVALDIPVAWGDLDAFGHVNNTVFFRWCESARILYFERAGIIERMQEEGIGPILARATLDFRQPVKYPDTVRASAGVTSIGRSSFVMGYRLSRLADGAVVGEGDSVVVMVDYRAGGKVAVDPVLRARIEGVEGRSGR